MSDQNVNKIILSHSSLSGIKEKYIDHPINTFFNELDRVCAHNKIDNFQEWFIERTFVSLYINGMVRADVNGNVSAIQEFVVDESESSSKGRCDALITFNQKELILLEAKFQKYPRSINESHWDFAAWETYDDYVFKQLDRYYNAEQPFYVNGRYDKLFFQTIVFKIIESDKDEHFQNATSKLNTNEYMLNGRGWYYSCYYPESINKQHSVLGIEVYGTFSEVKF